jgi:hypothetical protein
VTDDDRLMAYAERTLEDGCTNCGFSLTYCRCVNYLDGTDQHCCDTCSH